MKTPHVVSLLTTAVISAVTASLLTIAIMHPHTPKFPTLEPDWKRFAQENPSLNIAATQDQWHRMLLDASAKGSSSPENTAAVFLAEFVKDEPGFKAPIQFRYVN